MPEVGDVRRRPKDRGDQLAAAAVRLFAERGYHATGIKDIAEAVGITGAALYRHYSSKEELLLSATSMAGEQTHLALLAAVASSSDPEERLAAVIRNGARAVADSIDLMMVNLREGRHLEEHVRREWRRLQGRNDQIFVDAVLAVHPEMSERQVRFSLQSIAGLYLSVAQYHPRVSRSRLETIMTAMAMASLGRVAPMPEPELVVAQPATPGSPSRWPVDQRGSRREMLLDSAVRLFRQHGFHGVGINEIAGAAGVAGPGIYRYFSSKDQLLEAAFVRMGEQLAGGASRALTSSGPDEAVATMVDSYIQLAVGSRDLVAVYLNEAHSLGADERRRVTAVERAYFKDWNLLLRFLRPEMAAAEATACIRSAIGLVNGYAIGAMEVPRSSARLLLREMVAGGLSAVSVEV